MIPETLCIELLSDASVSRGEGVPGLVDSEVEHDASGLPFIGGKTLRGLLRDSWLSMSGQFTALAASALRIHGASGEALSESAVLRVGDAMLAAEVRAWVSYAVERKDSPLAPALVLEALTAIRSRTAESRESGAPERGTLRSSRVVRRGLRFWAKLSWLSGYQPTTEDVECLALSALATRHAGLGRNRGAGFIRVTLDGDQVVTSLLAQGHAI